MSLDVYINKVERVSVYSSNITHNLAEMAEAAGIYKHLWRPDELGIKTSGELITPLEEGLKKLKANPEDYEKYNAKNGWGMYKHFVPFVESYLDACKQFPDGEIEVSR